MTNTWAAPVTGLTCNGCVTTVTSQVTEIDGVTSVNVELVQGGTSTLTVYADREISDEEVQAALTAGGAFQLAR
ncbi:heavy metal transporter [Pseudoclavibacter sp. RFBG4]|uniref:heavy-metal-associated domain-containing protein n=1 Tax=Pseudoclavibacter sp. RFBG4 TaxID=2080575 RepID=UPI000CE8CDBE|nr:heavy metal-associated domain-containing protein [Pseudoclavibacter sp. RFBG4]PPG28621.1 heavy metal transporter [Pseudoclavibacter sp. RFBG4]